MEQTGIFMCKNPNIAKKKLKSGLQDMEPAPTLAPSLANSQEIPVLRLSVLRDSLRRNLGKES